MRMCLTDGDSGQREAAGPEPDLEAAADYSFEPDFKAYDEEGRADLYWNSIIGAVRKNYGAETIEGLFEALHGCAREQLFEQLLWLGLENAVYQREAPHRPALPPCGGAMPAGPWPWTRTPTPRICWPFWKTPTSAGPGGGGPRHAGPGTGSS